MDLRHYLFEREIQITDFAEKLGLHRNTIYGIMSGKKPASLTIALKIQKETRGKVTLAEIPLSEEDRELVRTQLL